MVDLPRVAAGEARHRLDALPIGDGDELALAIAVPALAGGANCGSHATAATANASESCVGKTKSAAWAGACLQRTATGRVTVADVAKGSSAARSGLKTGDIALAVNGSSAPPPTLD